MERNQTECGEGMRRRCGALPLALELVDLHLAGFNLLLEVHEGLLRLLGIGVLPAKDKAQALSISLGCARQAQGRRGWKGGVQQGRSGVDDN